MSMVLAGGEGKRLMPLTAQRAKPAVPFGGRYRLIDFALSNLVNSGYRKIVVLTQYKSHSLDVHISRTWSLSRELDNYVTTVPAQMRRGPSWFTGSLDAIYQNFNLIDDERPEHIIVFGADHIYRIDARQMLDAHIESGKGATVAGIRVPRDESDQFGVITIGPDSDQILRFDEKPTDPPGLPDSPDEVLASMGNYIFSTEMLMDLAADDAKNEDSKHDIGGDLIPALVAQGEANVYDFTKNVVPGDTERNRHYWRDVGTLDSYFDANMDLVQPEPIFNLYNPAWPIFSYSRNLPPAKFVTDWRGGDPEVLNSMVSAGVIVSGGRVSNSVISVGSHVHHGADLENVVLLDDVTVGAGAVLRNCVIDKNVVVPDGAQIGVDSTADAEKHVVSEGGITVISKNAVIEPT
ncbi:MAG: glucose-1-phosphate adenylyltransferase [Acidimicrobiia bacterium]|nr:glucose-1-phosphate adenylyltransferase [Acidimicrobiia bacterium]